MPTATGLILSSVPVSLRSFSSAVSMFLYNMLGYALGATLPGFIQTKIQENFDVSDARVLAWGIRLVLGWSLFGLVFGGLAAWHAHAEWKKAQLGGSGHFRRLRKRRRKINREVNDIVFDALDKANGDGIAQEGFDGMIRFGLEGSDSDSTDDDDEIDDETLDHSEASFQSSVTNDDINYEISRQYNPVFTGGANVLREISHSLADENDYWFTNAIKGRRTSYSMT